MKIDEKNINFDESTTKLRSFLEKKPNREQLEIFIKDNPGLVIKISAKEAEKAQKEYLKFMEKNPAGKQILEEEKLWMKMIHNKKE
ncbi:MAG: hypothetical protein ACFE9S_16495 [Candidatus Hermodarchaeota archaeon]